VSRLQLDVAVAVLWAECTRRGVTASKELGRWPNKEDWKMIADTTFSSTGPLPEVSDAVNVSFFHCYLYVISWCG
jgi:hypothetical protein